MAPGAPADVAEESLRTLRRVEELMPTESVEVRPGRCLAVHRRPCERPDVRSVAFLVHGSCASMVQWLRQAEMLATRHNVVAFDFFGCGRSPKPEGWSIYSCEELYRDLEAVVKRFGADEKDGGNVVVAHSMGCSLALRLASESSRVPLRALVLLAGFAEIPAACKGPLFYLPVSVLDLLQPRLSSGFESIALHEKTRSSSSAEHLEVLSLARATNNSNPMHMCKAYYRQLSMPSKEQLAQITAPVLLLHGEGDGLVDPSSSAQVAALLPKSAKLQQEAIADASHQLMQEQPDAVNTAIAAFLDGLPPAGASAS
mmetsp:Transcript_22757/g.65591  ORF Transcript_22757/g.65591 Transcript_22757/m.65591 type:complete len:314 (+) Transcript_22757:99-1040(+)|eukprot:CAMPEP_0170256006 /NCGR_PEP_ID=MMETSP0116_2-20130129/27856_1 /TAXON_ID=400756 /ORGANISM="Durinskia baltica, Strain CSIRO CS-38" /LENGTH=313 /DNA_ID=CAMNT_0010507015 /DNA_START=74 /DNA_END=1015 /DNA_ORIENTATION=-